MPRAPFPQPPLSDADANWCIYLTLGLILVTTVGTYIAGKASGMDGKTTLSIQKDAYLAARGTQGVASLTLSYFVSGIGAWVIFAVPQAAVIGGWVALAGYALSTVFPLLLFGKIAPYLRENVPNGFTLIEFVYARYGPINAAYFGLVSMFYMFLYLTAELASAGTLAAHLSKITVMDDTLWKNDNVFVPMPISPILGVSFITLAYTVCGGLPVSILTDRIQGAGIFLVTLIILIAAYAHAGGDTKDDDRFRLAAGHGIDPNYVDQDYGNSFAIAISLIMGVTCANMFHAGYWQRIWAAESNKAVVQATYAASLLSLLVMILFGVVGWIAYAHYGPGLIAKGGGAHYDFSWLAVPWIIVDFMSAPWCVIMLIFGIAMIASTADTLQSGMTALLWPVADKLFDGTFSLGGSPTLPKLSQNAKLAIIICTMAVINVPAMVIALSGQSILQIFLLADLLAATVVAPLLLGFWDRTHPGAALLGALSGLATLLITYAIAGEWGEGFDILMAQGGIFRRSATYAFCFTPVVSAAVTAGYSYVIPNYKFEGFKNAGGANVTTTTKDETRGGAETRAGDSVVADVVSSA
jgi:Na+/proline symporter